MMKTMMTAMKTSISEVMGTMFYLPVEFLGESGLSAHGFDDMDAVMACELAFSGQYSGKLTLIIPRDLLTEMTENFMGELKTQDTEDLLKGTLTETLNMICGNMLGRIESTDPFELDIPQSIETIANDNDQPFTIVETIIGSKMAIKLSLNTP